VSGDGHDPLAAGILDGDRKALARGITLVESTRSEDMDRAEQLLQQLSPSTGGACRLGITGVPGVGKSTFIESLGTHVTSLGHRLAVLAVDPSSAVTGGSILGDKTRMDRLSRDPNAFIRPSPSGGATGGVGRRTREASLLCEAAGFDVVIIETIGAGQAETAVADMVDFFLLLVLPGAGDELQGIKRGVMELANAVVVNKADGPNLESADRARHQLQLAIGLLHPQSECWQPPVLSASGLAGAGLAEIWEQVERYCQAMKASGHFENKRRDQALLWMEATLRELLLEDLYRSAAARKLLPALRQRVLDGQIQPTAAARRLLDHHSS
jgi:LAO/AO transport system kinase